MSRRSSPSKHRAAVRVGRRSSTRIEFNDEIACIDVLYDLSFLLMDLWRRRLPRHANAVLNTYLSETGDFGGVGLLPLFLSCRSAVRAKTSATAAQPADRPGSAAANSRTWRAVTSTLARNSLTPVGPLPHCDRRFLRIGEVDARPGSRAIGGRRARRLDPEERRNPQTTLQSEPAHASWPRWLHRRRHTPRLPDHQRACRRDRPERSLGHHRRRVRATSGSKCDRAHGRGRFASPLSAFGSTRRSKSS